jgi:LPS-assembly lipoprotein
MSWSNWQSSFRGARKASEPGIQTEPHAHVAGFRLSLRSAGMTRRLTRIVAVLALAGLTAGCFQPLYGDKSVVGGAGLGDKMSAVEVAPIEAPNGTRLSRLGVEVRNDLLFELTGGGPAAAPSYRLDIRLSSTNLQVIVDINTARPDIQNYGIDATYTLTEVGTGKKVIAGTTFSRVSYNSPGQQQRFAGDRGLRDAENRAAKVIAENLRARLASYFVAGT